MGATTVTRIRSWKSRLLAVCAPVAVGAMLGGCSISNPFWSSLPDAPRETDYAKDWVYRVGPGDSLNIFVWRNPELSQTVAVRPDGRFSTPLVKEFLATGKSEVSEPVLGVDDENSLLSGHGCLNTLAFDSAILGNGFTSIFDNNGER